MGCVEDVYRVCLRILWDVYVWSIGVRYIYLISVNVYGGYRSKRVFITNVKGTFFGMSESEEASKRR